ncbi:MAG: ion channel [Cyanobacteria bacterium J06638_7]
MASRKLQHHYRLLLANCVLLMATFTLPDPWYHLAMPGYLTLGVVMLRALGRRCRHGGRSGRGALASLRLYQGMGVAALAVGTLWMLTPLGLRGTGVPVAALWALFSVWSALRLVRQLGEERSVNAAVLRGALGGYLMLGLAGGLVFAALETTVPGSFSGVELASSGPGGQDPVWALNFVELNYFAFVTLTTTGYGELLPVTPLAQMSSMALAIAGNIYLASVLGLLIGRFSAQNDSGERG